MFPEIRQRIANFVKGEEPVSLGREIKSASLEDMTTDWYARNGYQGIYSALAGGMLSWSGERVSLTTAMNHSVVWACNKIISETVGFIPLVMLKVDNDPAKGKSPAFTHPMYRALKNSPNEKMSAMTFRETFTSHCVLEGNAYAQIIRRSGTNVAIGLELLLGKEVTADLNAARQLVYVVKIGNSTGKTYTVENGKAHDILHMRGIGNDGLHGYSVIAMGAQSIGNAIAAEKNVGAFWARGGRMPYVLEMAQRFKTREDFDRFRADWEATYSVPHRAPILENDIKYRQIGLNAKDAQLLETRLFTINEICRWFGVQPHLVGDLSRATFSNIEQLALEFVKLTLQTWLTRWEQDLWRCVLTPEEKDQNYLWKHNLNALLRGDFPSRMTGYATMLQNGIASQNEIRDLEDWNPFEGGDGHHIQLNMQTLPANGVLTPTAAPDQAAPESPKTPAAE